MSEYFRKPIVKILMLKGEKGEMGDLNHNDIIDNLTFTATDKVLSAKQGKILKDLVDTNATNIQQNTNDIETEIANRNMAINGLQTQLTEEANERSNVDNNLQNQISGLASGSPLVASSVSGMTDTTKVYVNTTDGNWYYYNGTSWTIGGVYQASENSDSVNLLNDLSEGLFTQVFNETFQDDSISIIRTYRPLNIKPNTLYRVEITVSYYHSSAPTEAFNLRSTLTAGNNHIKDNIFSFTKDNIPSGEQIIYFTPQNNASWLYFYFNVNGTYNVNVKVKELISDYKINTEKNINILNEIIKKGYTKTANFETTSPLDVSSGIQRLYYPYKFIKDKNYLINIKFKKYSADNNITYYALKTTLENNNDNIIDTIDEYTENIADKNISTFDGENLLYNYTPTNDCYYLHVYLRTHHVFKDYDFEIDVYEKDEEKVGNFTYFGKKINLNNNYFDCDLYMNITTPTSEAVQGMAIFDGKLFQCQHKGILNVYDFDNKNSTPLTTCNLGSYSETGNHANCINFSNKYYNDNTIPLAYIVGGNSGEVMECDVENITLTESGGTYTMTSELIQKITLDQTGFENAGYVPYWGWPCWLVSSDNKYLYLHGAKYRTNGSMREYDDDNRYIVTKFHYPDLSDSEVTLTADDVLEQFTTPYEIEVIQGGTIYNDKIYYSFGFGSSSYPPRIGVWDLRNKSYVSMIELKDTPVATQEPEDVCVYENNLYLMTGSKKLYKLEF